MPPKTSPDNESPEDEDEDEDKYAYTACREMLPTSMKSKQVYRWIDIDTTG
jgi:hypothetical protein